MSSYLFPPLWLESAVVVFGLVLLMVEAFTPRLDKRVLGYGAAAGLGLIFFASFFAGGGDNTFYTGDALAMFFKRFALVTTMVVLVMSVDYLGVVRKFTPGASAQGGLGEFLALPIFTCAGLMWMASAVDFVLVFVSLELVTISFYVLVTYTRRNAASLEAGVKYLILGALSTGFLVFGITWIFGVTGETNLARIGVAVQRLGGESAGLGGLTPALFGLALVLIALGFKIAAVPFQIWVPDVYQGAPTPVSAYLSVGSKAAGFVVLIRVLEPFLSRPALAHKVALVLAILAAATLVYGNLAALPQNNLKRLLAYSSIAHAGYLLMAVAALAFEASRPLSAATAASEVTRTVMSAHSALAFYLAGYLLMTLLAFAVMVVVSNEAGGDDIVHFNGLARRAPYLAFAMLVAMLSLAGLPLTAGGFGKFFVFTVTMAPKVPALNVLAAIGVVTVACGFYYYLKVIRAMYLTAPAEGSPETPIHPSHVTDFVLSCLVVLTLVLGVYPQPALSLLQESGEVRPVAVVTTPASAGSTSPQPAPAAPSLPVPVPAGGE